MAVGTTAVIAKIGTEVILALLPQIVRSMGYKWDNRNLDRVEKNMIENLIAMKLKGQIEDIPEIVSGKVEDEVSEDD